MYSLAMEFIKENHLAVMVALSAADFFLGTTNFFKSNSVIEMPFRFVGAIIVFLFGKKYGLKMDKRKGVVK